MLTQLIEAILPLRSIAKELRIIRELYEKELEYHDPPIVRVTQKPGKNDTTVSYADEPQKPKSALRKLMEEWDSIGETNDDQPE